MTNIKDIVFEPKYSQAVFDKTREWLVKNHNRAGATFCQMGLYVTKQSFSMACHASIKYNWQEGVDLVGTNAFIPDYAYAEHRQLKGMPTAEDYRPFWDWFITKSVYSRFVVWAEFGEGLIVSSDMPVALLQNMMIISRHFHEARYAFEWFNKWTSMGLGPAIAYVLAFNSTGSYMEPSPDTPIREYPGHRAMGIPTMDGLRNFLLGEIPLEDVSKKRFYRGDREYVGGFDIFEPQRLRTPGFMSTQYAMTAKNFVAKLFDYPEFADVLSSYRKGSGVGVVIQNPFARTSQLSLPQPGEITFGECTDVLVPFLATTSFLDYLTGDDYVSTVAEQKVA